MREFRFLSSQTLWPVVGRNSPIFYGILCFYFQGTDSVQLKLQRNTNPAVAGREIHTVFLFRNLRDRGDVEDPGLDRRIMNVKEKETDGVNWIRLAKDR
jgi:hypothetical protein